MFTPRSSKEILRELIAGVVGRSELTDVTEGSVLSQLLSVVALEMSSAEFRMASIRDSFFLESVSAGDLDDRVAELPPSGLTRLPASNATGGGFRVTRSAENAAVALTVPRGAVFGRSDNESITYVTQDDIVFAENVEVVANVSVSCQTAGPRGNCPPGSISRIISAHPSVIAIEQTQACAGGQEVETDAQLRARARDYLSSLARCQPTAIEFALKSYTASDGSRVQYASLYEDPVRRGYSEVVVDDGSAFLGVERLGQTCTGIVPAGGITQLWHERPATQPIQRVKRSRNGQALDDLRPDSFISIPERGILLITDENALAAGDTWEISRQGVGPESQYKVFGGALIPELQSLIEGDLDRPADLPGLRAAGTRVRVVPPTTSLVAIDAHIVPVGGIDFSVVTTAIENAIIAYFSTLTPGQPLYVARLIDRLMNNPDLLNIHLYEGGVHPAVALSDVYPEPRQVLRTKADLITIIPPVEV